MFEAVGRLWRQTLLVEKLGGYQLLQSLLQRAVVPRGDCFQQRIREFAPHGGTQLRQTPDRRQAVQACHQRVMQRAGNRQRREPARQRVPVFFLPQKAGFKDHLGELFNEQRHTVGLGDHLPHNLRRQLLALRNVANQLEHLIGWKARKSQLGDT
ncbi:hypothetical protein CKJ70_08135 [Mycobacterium avium]|nr:hypothetical protein CKJ70_08135 [Mycobacterium avium]